MLSFPVLVDNFQIVISFDQPVTTSLSVPFIQLTPVISFFVITDSSFLFTKNQDYHLQNVLVALLLSIQEVI